MILLFKIFVFRSRENVYKKRSILRVKKEVEVKMIKDYGHRERGRHGQRGICLMKNYNEYWFLYSFSNSAACSKFDLGSHVLSAVG
jgi:hypothetical protein